MTTAAPPERDPTTLEALAVGYRLSQCIASAAELGLAEELREGPRSATAIAAAHGWDADHLFRVMRYLASEGIFAAPENGTFALNAISRRLLPEAPDSALAMIRGWHTLPLAIASFSVLTEAIRTGATAFDLAHGAHFHDYLAAHPEAAAAYNAAMESTEEGFAAGVAAYDFSRFGSLVDIGGGEGAFLRLLHASYPALRCTLFELPHVAEAARLKMKDDPSQERIEVIGGDMFQAVPAGADAYTTSTVLRCFDDFECIRILENCREVMNPGGKVLAFEPLVENGAAPSISRMDVVAMVLYGGRDRTRAEWSALGRRTRLRLEEVIPVDGPFHWLSFATI